MRFLLANCSSSRSASSKVEYDEKKRKRGEGTSIEWEECEGLRIKHSLISETEFTS